MRQSQTLQSASWVALSPKMQDVASKAPGGMVDGLIVTFPDQVCAYSPAHIPHNQILHPSAPPSSSS